MRRLRPKIRHLLVGLLIAGASAILRAQTPSPTPTPTATATPPSATATPTPTPQTFTTPSAQNWTTDGDKAANGSRVAHTEDGSTWFITAASDRIARLRDTVMTQWPIRADADLGANPVDFQIDGDTIWFIENGQSLIDAGKSIIARLDTTTGTLREWVLPSSRPAGFYRAPDGKLWIPQTAGVLESLDLQTLEVVDYRALPTATFASALTLGPDGALWMTDFGGNRIVRHDLTDNSQKAWTILNPGLFRLNPSDLKFDSEGNLWIAEFSGTRVDRFNPATGELRTYLGFASPVHLDIFGGNIYVSQQTGGNGRISILDPKVAAHQTVTLTPDTLTVAVLPRLPAQIRDSVITPITFTSTLAAFAPADLTVTASGAGVLNFQYNKTNAYGLTVDNGAVWTGSNGFLVRLIPQTLGGPTDQTIPLALQYGSAPADTVRVDLTLSNRGSEAISGTALFQYSAGAFPRSRAFTLAPGETALLQDAFAGAATSQDLVNGPIRLQVTAGQAADLYASARSARYLDNSGSFGLAAPAQNAAEILQSGTVRTLFTGSRTGDIATFGYFSPAGGQAVVQLIAPDGTVRGTQEIEVASNVVVEHNPTASLFGVAPEPGDVLLMTVTAGVLQPYVSVQDPATRDVAISLPIAASTDLVIPNVASIPTGSVLWTSTLQLSNSDAAHPATVVATYFPIGSGASSVTLTLPPGGSLAIADVVADLFGAAPGQGALTLTSNVPIAASQRIAAQAVGGGGQYASQSPALDGSTAVPSGGLEAIGVLNTNYRRSNLLLFNRGAAGTVTINAFDASGAAVGQLLLPVGAQSAARVNRVLEAAGAGGVDLGRIRVQASAGMQLYAQTVDVDGVTADTDLYPLR
jgi:virginiamycin B lyase